MTGERRFILLRLVYEACKMAKLLSFGFVILVASDISHSFSSKLDFGEEEESSPVVTNSSKDNEDIEVQHTIVVSTKLKNNNRGGFQNARDVNTDTSIQRSGQFQNRKRDDSGEVPVVKGYNALGTTQILTPDTRLKSIPINPIRHNAPDEYDVYPNFATNQMQFKPSNFYNNANWWNQDSNRNGNNFIRRNDGTLFSNTKSGFHRSLTDDGVRDFYCKKCREMGGGERCLHQRSNTWTTTTTPRIKVDGKIAKLN